MSPMSLVRYRWLALWVASLMSVRPKYSLHVRLFGALWLRLGLLQLLGRARTACLD